VKAIINALPIDVTTTRAVMTNVSGPLGDFSANYDQSGDDAARPPEDFLREYEEGRMKSMLLWIMRSFIEHQGTAKHCKLSKVISRETDCYTGADGSGGKPEKADSNKAAAEASGGGGSSNKQKKKKEKKNKKEKKEKKEKKGTSQGKRKAREGEEGEEGEEGGESDSASSSSSEGAVIKRAARAIASAYNSAGPGPGGAGSGSGAGSGAGTGTSTEAADARRAARQRKITEIPFAIGRILARATRDGRELTQPENDQLGQLRELEQKLEDEALEDLMAGEE
jgi:hypothetical protein